MRKRLALVTLAGSLLAIAGGCVSYRALPMTPATG